MKIIKTTAIVLGVLALLLLPVLLSTGCATRRYVRQQCWEARREARAYTADQRYELAMNIYEEFERLDLKIKLMEKKSDVGRAAAARTKQDIELERIIDEAIREAADLTDRQLFFSPTGLRSHLMEEFK